MKKKIKKHIIKNLIDENKKMVSFNCELWEMIHNKDTSFLSGDKGKSWFKRTRGILITK